MENVQHSQIKHVSPVKVKFMGKNRRKLSIYSGWGQLKNHQMSDVTFKTFLNLNIVLKTLILVWLPLLATQAISRLLARHVLLESTHGSFCPTFTTLLHTQMSEVLLQTLA